jgi:2-oxoglutarate ferredoxin oxidoreductase subunit gamma
MNIRVSGIGGQGVVLIAYILGKAAIDEGYNAVQTKTYGSAYRGTLCKSDVIISKNRICELEFFDTDILICLSKEGYELYKDGLKSDGYLFYDHTLVPVSQPPPHSFCLDVFELSRNNFDSKIFGNIIMLGYLIGTKAVVSKEAIKNSIEETVPKHTIDKNIDAFHIGYHHAIKK